MIENTTLGIQEEEKFNLLEKKDEFIYLLLSLYSEFNNYVIHNNPHYLDSDFSFENFIKYLIQGENKINQ